MASLIRELRLLNWAQVRNRGPVGTPLEVTEEPVLWDQPAIMSGKVKWDTAPADGSEGPEQPSLQGPSPATSVVRASAVVGGSRRPTPDLTPKSRRIADAENQERQEIMDKLLG